MTQSNGSLFRRALLLTVALLCAGVAGGAAGAGKERPNILVIVADDMRYGS